MILQSMGMLLLVSINSKKIFLGTFSSSYMKLLQLMAKEQVCLSIDKTIPL